MNHAKGKNKTAGEAMNQLEAAAEASSVFDVSPLVAAYEAMDWHERPADDYARTVQLALGIGAHMVARALALAGAKRYPNHAELKKMAYILAPPKVIASNLPPDPSARGNMAWLKKHWDDYWGKWVALCGGE